MAPPHSSPKKLKITIAWGKYWLLKSILKEKYKNEHKADILSSCILPT